jgi:hypothetical protein
MVKRVRRLIQGCFFWTIAMLYYIPRAMRLLQSRVSMDILRSSVIVGQYACVYVKELEPSSDMNLPAPNVTHRLV